ncbi:MAG: hypothetical protein WBZ36_09180 [Candidatus Nitrosopolaris sp.]
MSYVRYLVKCKLNSSEKDRLLKDLKSGSLARGKIFYEGMQAALSGATIDENNVVQFIEVYYCLEGGLYPMAMEIPVLKQYFESVSEVKDARFRDQCTMECEFCDCTRSRKLPGKQLMNELNITQEGQNRNDKFMDMGRIKLNRKKQKEGIHALKILLNNDNRNLTPIFASAAISGLFAVFYDGDDYFRVKNIPDNNESRVMLRDLGLELYNSVDSIKSTARRSLAGTDTRSNVV